MVIKTLRKQRKLKLIVFFGIFLSFSALFFFENEIQTPPSKDLVGSLILESIQESNDFLNQLQLEGDRIKVEYNIDEQLQSYIDKLLKRYRSDHAAVVVIDNNTHEIIALSGYSREPAGRNLSIAFSNDHPSASLFKIVTASSLLENTLIRPESEFQYVGRSNTMYKYQLRKKKNYRWSRLVDFKKAFANSNNVVFGKAAIYNLNLSNLLDTAKKFGFEKDILGDLDIERSTFLTPLSQYEYAELASGFNRETKFSPIHGAILSSVIVNDGLFIQPRLIRNVSVNDESIELFSEDQNYRAISSETAKKMRKLMEETVRRGTARKSFRRLRRNIRENFSIGGKTGTITGGRPYGKRDWFTSYALPNDSYLGRGISICVMNVNVKKWYVKSAALTKEIIENYYRDVKVQRQGRLFASRNKY